MKATITIQMDNDAFTWNPAEELARILRELAARVTDNTILAGTEMIARDINGNRVGSLVVEGDD